MLDFLDLFKRLYNVKSFTGYTEEEIGYLEQKFGHIPEVLMEFYKKAGATKKFQHGQDRWITPEDYKSHTWIGEIDGLLLLNENQGVCQAGIHMEDLNQPDPPVYVYFDGEGWSSRQCAPSVSEFLAAALAYEAAFTLEYTPEDFYYVYWEDKKEFQSRLKKYPFEMKNWMYDINITFYYNDPYNLVAVLDCESTEDDGLQLVYGAVNEEAYNKLEKALEGVCEPF